MNAANWHRKSIRRAKTGSATWSTGRCARNLNLTLQTNGLCTTQNLSKKMTHINSYVTGTHTDHIISTSRPDLIIINKKKRPCKIVDFAVPADYWINLKENEKQDKYLDLARELKKLWNMRVYLYLYRFSPWSGWTGFPPSKLLLIEEDTLGFIERRVPKSYPEKRPVCCRFSTDALTDRPDAAGCWNKHLLDFHYSPFSRVSALIPRGARPIHLGWPYQESKFPTA